MRYDRSAHKNLYILLSLVTYHENAEQLVLDKDHSYGAYVGGVRAVFPARVNVSTLTHIFGDPPSIAHALSGYLPTSRFLQGSSVRVIETDWDH